VTMRANGSTMPAIADHLNRSLSCVAHFLGSHKKDAVAAGLAPADWKEDMRVKAVDGINAGLTCETDAYKRGNLGVRVMVGLGYFTPDNNTNINQIINAIPPEWRERYSVTIEGPVDQPETITVGDV